MVTGKLWGEGGGRHLAPKTMFEHDAKLDVGVRVRRDRPSARRGAEGTARALARREGIPLGATYPKVRCTGPEGGLQGQAREDGASPGRRIRRASRKAFP